MPAAAPRRLIGEGLAPLVRQAALRAERRGRPVLASLTSHVGMAGGFDVGALADQPDAYLWQQPDRGFALAGVGQAVRIAASGPERFEVTRTRLMRLLEDAVVSQDSGAALHPAPLALAGFSFDPERPDNVAWFGYPDAQIMLPRLLFSVSGSHLFVTANLLVAGGAEASQECLDLGILAERLIAEASSPSLGAVSSHALDPGADARTLWGESVEALTRQIATGGPEKVVLARRVQVESSDGFDVRAVFSRMRQRFSECTIFAIRNGGACFAGATPEMLVSLRGRRVRADCLAGSARRGRDEVEDARLGRELLEDEKERREHAFVARGIEESLIPICAEITHPDAPGLRRMANVQHLYTPIEALTDGDRHVLELVERLHPTAATAGLPRERALCLIREQEPFSRGWYAGAIGWIDASGGGEFAVALRSALLRDEVASLYAGCGIVTGSQPEREWAESEIKLQAMLWALNASGEQEGGR